jgi:MoaA/NifB/PqqE/SkfB family radical SAM enzyme
MCEVWKLDDSKREELTTSEIISFLDYTLDKVYIDTVKFCGGETLIREDMETIISEISSRVYTTMTTNGTLITEERAKKLVESKLHSIRFSIDGTEQSNDSLRGKGSFKKSISGLENLYKAKKEMNSKNPVIYISPCISKKNANELNEMIEIAKKYDAHLEVGNFLNDMHKKPKDFLDGKEITIARAKDPLQIAFNKEEKIYLRKKYFSQRNITGTFFEIGKQKLRNFINGKLIYAVEENYYDCSRSRRQMTIDPWGDAYPCEYLTGYKYGNIKQGGIEIWNSIKRKEIREKIKNGDLNICQNCNKELSYRGIRSITDIKSFNKFFLWLLKDTIRKLLPRLKKISQLNV